MSFLRIPPLAGEEAKFEVNGLPPPSYLPTLTVGGERLYTLLRPTACGAGEGHVVARGICGVESRAASS